MVPLSPEHREELRAHLARRELDAFLMLANLEAGGMVFTPKNPRSGLYYRWGDSVLALYASGMACALLEDEGALQPFSALVSKHRVARLYATPLEPALTLDSMVRDKTYHYALIEQLAVQRGPLPQLWPQAFTFERLLPQDQEGFVQYARLFNQVQDERLEPDHFQAIARVMQPPEGMYLGRYQGQPCMTTAVEAMSPSYLYIGSAAVDPAMRGKGLAQATLAYLCRLARSCGRQGLSMVAQGNAPPSRVLAKCGYQALPDRQWLLVWYEP
ncbi:MAG TPA: GNAT family N-acetyltransferase [Candidatus Excrementavichristensenella intestinipullorum]|nr:GNAT family N-acetyltransferase [Candidatus Excrementavichristensenella intestinipullorum]